MRNLLSYILPKYFGIASGRGFLSGQRKEMLEQAFMYTDHEEVLGDYLEFGVARGRTLIFAHKAAEKYASKVAGTTFIGFDSFEGFPTPKGVDREFERFKEGEENHGGEGVVWSNLRKYGIRRDAIRLIKGWYDETLTLPTESYGISRARVVNIDCDMFESTRMALNFIAPVLQQGTVVLFDDWYCYRSSSKRGERAALDSWLSENVHCKFVPYRQYANVGQSFIVDLGE